MSEAKFTAEQKAECAAREVRMRRRVYLRWVESGKITPQKAKYETELMEEIEADYRFLAKSERLL